jgi:hypothetical protein
MAECKYAPVALEAFDDCAHTLGFGNNIRITSVLLLCCHRGGGGAAAAAVHCCMIVV